MIYKNAHKRANTTWGRSNRIPMKRLVFVWTEAVNKSSKIKSMFQTGEKAI